LKKNLGLYFILYQRYDGEFIPLYSSEMIKNKSWKQFSLKNNLNNDLLKIDIIHNQMYKLPELVSSILVGYYI